MQERVDIVDQNQDVLCSVTKQEAHEKGLLHKTVISEVIGSDGKWLLVKQASDRQDAGQLVSPVGGHVSSGETNDNALKREALEELGIKDFTYNLVGSVIFNRNVIGRQENHYFVLYEINSDESPVINHESESFEYFSVSELKLELKNEPQTFGDAFHFIIKTFYSNFLEE